MVVLRAEAYPAAGPVGVRERAVDGLLRCVARHGLAKTTLEDVAAAAGCSRATLYRYVANKRELVGAAVESEMARLVRVLADATADATDLADALTALVVTTARFVDGHGALRTMLDDEPHLVLPLITFERGDQFLARAAPAFGAPLQRFVGAEAASRVGEWLLRLLLTSLTFADERTDLTDRRRARALVERFIVPVLEREPVQDPGELP